MKHGQTIQELAIELAAQRAAKDDFVVDSRELTLLTGEDGGSELHLPNGEEFFVRDVAHSQIADRLRIPFNYYQRLRGEHRGLLDQNVNTLLRAAAERRMVRTFDWTKLDRFPADYVGAAHRENPPKQARAFLSDRYRRLDNDELAEAALPMLMDLPDARVESCALTERRMYIKVITPRVEAEVKRGDVVQAGVVLSNSEVGSGALKVQPLIFRLVCLNGMVVAEATRKYHIGRQVDSDDTLRVLSDETLRKDDAALFSKLQDVVRAAVDQTRFEAIVAQLRDAAGTERMAKPIDSMEVLAKRFDLADGEKQSVLGHLIEGGDLTAYGALNAFTRAAQDVESYDRSTELEEAGGKILAMAATGEWGTVARAG